MELDRPYLNSNNLANKNLGVTKKEGLLRQASSHSVTPICFLSGEAWQTKEEVDVYEKKTFLQTMI